MPIRFLFAVLLSGLVVVASSALPPTVSAQQARAVTFAQLLDYLELQVPESKIQQLVAASPSRFVLGTDQLDRLRAAGASEALLQSLASPAPALEAGSDVTDFVLILDCSGSMNDQLKDGGSKWEAARRAALELVASIPAGRRFSLIVYGTDLARKCHSVDVVRPLTSLAEGDKSQLTHYIGQLKAIGHTPIAHSLERAGMQLDSASGMSSIILITDGMESCHGDPAAVAGQLAARLPNLRGGINVIGFCLGDDESRQVARIAEAGHGEFYDARTAAQLLESVRQIESRVVQPASLETVDFEGLSPLERLLIEQLADADIDVREKAARTLGERTVRAAVPALRNMIIQAPYGTGIYGDSDRIAAIDAILAIDPDQAGVALSAALTSANRKVRIWAAGEVRDHQVTGAVAAVTRRMLAMNDADMPVSAINGNEEADALFDAVEAAAPEQLETVIVQLMRTGTVNVRAWASAKAAQLR